jgi:hypothetical protein
MFGQKLEQTVCKKENFRSIQKSRISLGEIITFSSGIHLGCEKSKEADDEITSLSESTVVYFFG